MDVKTPQQIAQSQRAVWEGSHYYPDAEKYFPQQWEELIWPVIEGCDFSRVVDLACGHGRNTRKLSSISETVIGVDLVPKNIDFCRKIATNNCRFVECDGCTIPVEDNRATLIYCFDAMVHFDPAVVHQYLRESQRCLQRGGFAFFHHSNYSGPMGSGGWRTNPHARNIMTQWKFSAMAENEGLSVKYSRVIDWGLPPHCVKDLDCITLLRKP